MKRLAIFLFISSTTLSFAQTENEIYVGSNESQQLAVVCIPNPTTDLLLVKSETEIKAITCFNSSGQEIRVTKLPNNCLSLEELPTGWVFVVVEGVDGKVAKKQIYKL